MDITWRTAPWCRPAACQILWPSYPYLRVAKFEENDINVKEVYSLRTLPCRIAPDMSDDLKGEIDDLISKGIIVPSRSP